MKYVQFKIAINEGYQEALIAELEKMDFDGFQQFDDELVAYISQKNIQIGDRERIEQLLAVYSGNNFIQTEEIIEEKNWNSEWEKTIQPQTIGSFLVKPTWSTVEPKKEQILLEIDPKMAFGTGYHFTTRLMLKVLADLISKDDTVLDAGTGTGILAIAAAKLGAEKVIAFDNDDWSINNARENTLLNNVSSAVEIRKGSVEVVEEKNRFDVILANINRNTILKMIPSLNSHLKEGGSILLSGILKKDETAITDRLKSVGNYRFKTGQEKEWSRIWAKKR